MSPRGSPRTRLERGPISSQTGRDHDPYRLGQIRSSLQVTHFQAPSTFCMQLGHPHLSASSAGGFSSIARVGRVPRNSIAALKNATTIERIATSLKRLVSTLASGSLYS